MKAIFQVIIGVVFFIWLCGICAMTTQDFAATGQSSAQTAGAESSQITQESRVAEVPDPTPTTKPTPTREPRPTPVSVTVNANANVRSGPGTNYEIVGSAQAGDVIKIIACDQTCEWYRISNGRWIAGFLLESPPRSFADSVVNSPKTIPQDEPQIPGFHPMDLVLSLQDEGFDCEDFLGLYYYSTTCELNKPAYSVTVIMYSRESDSLDFVNASIIQFGTPSEAPAIEYFAWLATIPYDGSRSNDSVVWVRETVPTIYQDGDVRVKTIGGVKFELFGGPQFRTLYIGHLVDP